MKFILWECSSCEFDCILEENKERPYCPICAEDNGVDRLLTNKGEPTPSERVEGVDERGLI